MWLRGDVNIKKGGGCMLGYKGLADFLCMITTGDKAGWTRERARPGKRAACFGVFSFFLVPMRRVGVYHLDSYLGVAPSWMRRERYSG